MCGCCHEAGYKKKAAQQVTKDPVCGKKIDCEDNNAIRLPYGDQLYFFCSTTCMTKFINTPEAYTRQKKSFFSFLKLSEF